MWLLKRVAVFVFSDFGDGRLSSAVEGLDEGGGVAQYGVAPCYITVDLEYFLSLEVTVAALLGLLPPIWVLLRLPEFLPLLLSESCFLD